MEYFKETFINAAPESVFRFHLLPDAFERLMPPWEKATIIQAADISQVGSRAIIETRILGIIPVRWVAEHTRFDPPRLFEDVQISGPFKSWRHLHVVSPQKDGTLLRDEIEFEPPLGFLGRIASPIAIFPKLEKMFKYRHQVTKSYLESAN